jgi:pimeloyl-ACP methyl ester carboxylesterase
MLPLLYFVVTMLVFFVLFGPFRRRVLRMNCVVEPVRLSTGYTLVVLVHGTFARGARWTSSTHNFCDNIERAIGPCNTYRLLWSGDNCHSERLNAALHLANWLSCQSEHSFIYLIGHSHGGNIAALAATILNSRRVRVVTMATPFINIYPRHAGFLKRREGQSGVDDDKSLLLGIAIYVLLGILMSVRQDIISAIGLLLVLGFLWLLVATFELQGFIERKMEALIARIRALGNRIARNSRVSLHNNSLLILRATGDEASGMLMVSQMTSWALYSILKMLGFLSGVLVVLEDHARALLRRISELRVLDWGASIAIWFGYMLSMTYITINIPSLSEIAFQSMLLVFAVFPVFLSLVMRIPSLVVNPALTIVGAVAAFIANLPFGIDLAASSAIVSITAESAPLGTWPITTVVSGNSLLAHSHLYDSEEISSSIADFHKSTCLDMMDTLSNIES